MLLGLFRRGQDHRRKRVVRTEYLSRKRIDIRRRHCFVSGFARPEFAKAVAVGLGIAQHVEPIEIIL